MILRLPRFYRHLHKEENDEIGGGSADVFERQWRKMICFRCLLFVLF